MPELPDVELYLNALRTRIVGERLLEIRISSPFVLRTVSPIRETFAGRVVLGVRRIGKRVVLEVEEDLFVVIHLMIAGRFRWLDRGAKIPRKIGLAAFDFPSGSLLLTEAGSKKRASIHLVQGTDALRAHDPGGAEPLEIDRDTFAAILRAGNHTLKRALTDPHNFSGIGNAYSDEILHAARLSPLQLTSRLDENEIDSLYAATTATLQTWIDRLREQSGDRFPEKVTAFRPEMAVHGRFGEPCPACGSPVQRIVYAENETNYCATCQTDGKLLRDRALSRLLREDWPRSIDEL